ncbi:MAG: hypothetical protein IJ660_04300 [Alphaproteobacteria bacterium]|nr:hypothetical protein [Alphaproteobacteria bacterium]
MKKYVLIVVLAVAACTTMSAQDRIERTMYSILRGFDRYERVEDNVRYLRAQLGFRERGHVTLEKDYQYGIIEERCRSKTVGIWTANYYVHIHDLFVATYRITPQGLQQVSYIPRDRYGDFWIVGDVRCGARTGLRLNIINNMERTMVWLWNGNNLYKGVTIPQPPKPRSRVNVAPRRFKTRWH